jgi:SSS family solute:Na+ symporter
MLAKTRFVPKHSAGASRIVTMVLGAVAIGLALFMESVLDVMLYSYAFMVSGLLVPVLAILARKTESAAAALTAMLMGGCVTVSLSLLAASGRLHLPFDLDANTFGLCAAGIGFLAVRKIHLSGTRNG